MKGDDELEEDKGRSRKMTEGKWATEYEGRWRKERR